MLSHISFGSIFNSIIWPFEPSTRPHNFLLNSVPDKENTYTRKLSGNPFINYLADELLKVAKNRLPITLDEIARNVKNNMQNGTRYRREPGETRDSDHVSTLTKRLRFFR